MKNKLTAALNEISDAHIAEAAKFKKRSRLYWTTAVAAVLTCAILIGLFSGPAALRAEAVSLAEYPKYQRHTQPMIPQDLAQLTDFFTSGMGQVLSGNETCNPVFSPVNLYLALSIAAELTGGDEQILQLLNADSMDTLRPQAKRIWDACYLDSKNQTLLANSLWLDDSLDNYNQSLMDTLAENYFTSVYQTDLNSESAGKRIATWVNSQTGGLLKEHTANISMDPEIVLALYATVYYQAKWTESCAFSASKNTKDLFHGTAGDITCTFMNHEPMHGDYYWGEDFGAVSLSLKDGSQMWLILPDTDKTVDDVLASGEYARLIMGDTEWENSKYMKINLSLPKFDIQNSSSLKDDLQALGVTNIFQPETADFSAAIPDTAVWLTDVSQATRVAIDEEGVTAASYIELPGAGAAMPPEEIIDFVLDRPFLFVIANRYDLPLFAGVVNNP